jgi:hypothetical protein
MASNPYDQFDAPAAAATNPYDQFDAKPSSGGGGGFAQKLASAGTLGGSDWVKAGVNALARGTGIDPTAPTHAEILQQNEQYGQEHPYLSLAADVGGYAGLSALTGGLGAEALIGKTALTGLPALYARGATEGAIAGAGSNMINDPSNPMGAVSGGASGAALGAGATGLTRGVNKALQATLGKAPSVDPAAAIASTKAASDAGYAALKQVPIDPAKVLQPIAGVASSLDPSMQTGMSAGFRTQVGDITQALSQQAQAGKQVNAEMVDSWQRQIKDAASSPVDTKIAGQISTGLDGVLQAHGAGDLQDAAQNAYKQSVMAQNLGEWSRKAAVGAPLGQAPLTEAERFYQGTPEYGDLVNLYKKSEGQFDPSWALGHMAAGAAGDLGGWMFGFPGHFLGEMGGYLGIKPAIKGAFKGMKQNAVGRNIQSLYPSLTGVQPTGGAQAPQVGDLIKNAMLGVAY